MKTKVGATLDQHRQNLKMWSEGLDELEAAFEASPALMALAEYGFLDVSFR